MNITKIEGKMEATHIYRERDDYGRSVLVAARGGRTIAVLVTVPKATKHLTPGTHFINYRASATPSDVTWYPDQRQARAAFDAILAAHPQEGDQA